MDKPTAEEWNIMHDSLDAYIMHLRKMEPGAYNTINVLEEATMNLPLDVDEAFTEE